MRIQPFGFANLITAADFHADGPREIAVVGDPRAAETEALFRQIRQCYVPNRTLMVVDPVDPSPRPALLAGKSQRDGKPTVYVCRHRTCSAPATAWADIEPLLQ